MREVTQSILAGDPSGIPGDCVRAAVASLLDREPTSVPHFIAGSDIDSRVWWYALKGWAAENGWSVTRRGLLPRQWNVDLPEFGLACGPSERGVSHAVVVIDGKVAWDPHPSRAGILRVREVIEFEREALLAGVECVLLDHAAELSGPTVDPNLAELAYRYLAVVGDDAPAEIREAIEAAEALAAVCAICGGVPCSECGECAGQGCRECRCDRRDRDDDEREDDDA